MSRSLLKTTFKNLLFIIFLSFSSCDFSSSLHNNIYLAQEYVQGQQYKKALALYKSILDQVNDDELKLRLNFQIAEISSIYLRKYKDSLKYYQRVFEQSNKPIWQVKSLEKLADINFTFIKNYQQSAHYYSILMDFKPKLASYDFYEFQVAKSHMLNKKYRQAQSTLLSIIKNNTHEYHVPAYFEMGVSYFYKQNWKDAIGYFNEYLKREVNRSKIVNAKYMIANAYETDEKLKKAYNVYYSILNEHPNTEMIKERLNSIYQRQVARKR